MPGLRPSVAEDPAATPHESPGVGRYACEAGTSRVLIVHPDPAALSILGSILSSSRYEIIEETSAPGALRRLANPPSLVLIGVNPDEPDALELLAYVRRKHPWLPTVLLFSTTHPVRSGQALRMGATAVLESPVPPIKLRATLTRALESGETRRQAGEPRRQTVGPAIGMRAGGALSKKPAVEPGVNQLPLKVALEGPEREIILRRLEACNGSRRETAAALDINRTTLYKKMKKYNLLCLTLPD